MKTFKLLKVNCFLKSENKKEARRLEGGGF